MIGNHLLKYWLYMLGCSFVAMLLNPLFMMAGIEFYSEEPILILFYVLSYSIMGVPLLYLLRCCKNLSIKMIVICIAVNTVLMIFVTFWIRHAIDDGMTGLMIFTAFLANALFSAIPIGFCCYYDEKSGS